ncbi:MAG: hypothetical protein ACE5KM_21115, partial [Planctomycetaceae bacterium]
MDRQPATTVELTTTGGGRDYVCPGETHAISRPVHLARLAAYYPKCRDCRHRQDAGHLAVKALPDPPSDRYAPRRSLMVGEGVRGVYLNELDRAATARFTAAFAGLLWERVPRPADRRPVVVAGCDQRPSSPDLIAGVFEALKRMGCTVVDVGPTFTPHFRSSVREQNADGGVFVTGAGCEPSWNGLDFVGREARPISESVPDDFPVSLQDIHRRAEHVVSRPTRNAGSLRTLRAWARYERALRDAYHALRPLAVVVGTTTAVQRRVLMRLFDALPCRLTVVQLPMRGRDLGDPLDPDVRRLGGVVAESRAHLGFLLDEDAQRCAAVDETGAPVPPIELTCMLAGFVRSETDGSTILLEEETPRATVGRVAAGGAVHVTKSSCAHVAATMRERNADFAGGPSGRFWFRNPGPVCDALVTLAYLLAA